MSMKQLNFVNPISGFGSSQKCESHKSSHSPPKPVIPIESTVFPTLHCSTPEPLAHEQK